ncbi:MAG: hypothetical protein J5719_02185 [Bacteroidales bacterium]|nr:hypothetical protein [Bacteroidales bacterium]
MKNHRVLFVVFILSTLSFSTNAQHLIGSLKLITDRPIIFHNRYDLLQKNEGLKSDMYDFLRGASIQDAAHKTISSCRCGEFLMNAEIYAYEDSYIVTGDVWGERRNTCLFEIGDIVTWGKKKRALGEILSFKDEDECIVKELRTNKKREMDFDDIYLAKLETREFQVGDKVTWKELFVGYKTGTIISKRSEYGYLVKESESGKQKELKADELFLINE